VHGLLDTAQSAARPDYPIRRCNIDCGYCNEYDKVVAAGAHGRHDGPDRQARGARHVGRRVQRRRADAPSGLDGLIRRIRSHGMMAGLITNGYYLVPKRIEQLNEAGLDFLQISIDNVRAGRGVEEEPARPRQEAPAPARHATFDININSVLGGGIKNAEERARSTSARASSGSRPPSASSTTARGC